MSFPQPQLNQPQYIPICVLDDILPESKDIASQFICLLCKGICFDPIDIPDNDSFICQKCFEIYKQNNKTFPHSTTLITNHPLHPITALVKIIYNLKVQCKNRKRGCTWQGTASSIKEHISLNCEHQDIPCINEGCKAIFIRNKLQEHLINCDYRNETCKDCGLNLPFIQLDAHGSICPKMKYECKQGCGMIIIRENEMLHIQNDCTKTEIECPFKGIGCDMKMLRGELDVHLENENAKHLSLFFMDFKSFKENVEKEINDKIDKTYGNVSGIINDIFEKKFEMFTTKTIKDIKSSMMMVKHTAIETNNNINTVNVVSNNNINNNNNNCNNIITHSNSNTNNKYIDHKRKRSISSLDDDFSKSDSDDNNNDILHENDNTTSNKDSLDQLNQNDNDISSTDTNSFSNNNKLPFPNASSSTTTTPPCDLDPHKPKPKLTLINTSLPKGIECCFIKTNTNNALTYSYNTIKSALQKNNREHEYCFTYFDIDTSIKGVITEWQFEMNVGPSVWIGFGLCDKKQVIDNKKKFFNKTFEFYNGTFCVSSNGYMWNCNRKEENNLKIHDMKPIKDNEVIKFRYINDIKELWFKLQKQGLEGKITQVYPRNSNLLNICVVFLNGENMVELQCVKKMKAN